MKHYLLALCLLQASGLTAASSFVFSTGNVTSSIAAASRPASTGKVEIEAADDFDLPLQTSIDSARFYGLLPSSAPGTATRVVAKIYRVYPLDSDSGRTPNVPTRTNSPADVDFVVADSASATLGFSVTTLSASFSALNSVLNGINPKPNQFTGGEGFVQGAEARFDVSFTPPLVLPAGHYFLVAEVLAAGGDFYWLSGTRPIVSPGTPFASDLQANIRNQNLAPDWLRIGTDIIGGSPAPTYNLAFTLGGEDDHIFGNGFN
jgi:hypothetical protein